MCTRTRLRYAWQCVPEQNFPSMLRLVRETMKKAPVTPCTRLKVVTVPQAHLFQVILFTSINVKMLSFNFAVNFVVRRKFENDAKRSFIMAVYDITLAYN